MAKPRRVARQTLLICPACLLLPYPSARKVPVRRSEGTNKRGAVGQGCAGGMDGAKGFPALPASKARGEREDPDVGGWVPAPGSPSSGPQQRPCRGAAGERSPRGLPVWDPGGIPVQGAGGLPGRCFPPTFAGACAGTALRAGAPSLCPSVPHFR